MLINLHSHHFLQVLRSVVAMAAAAAAILTACGGPGESPESPESPAVVADPEAEAHPTVDPNATPTPDPGPASATVRVELNEWAVLPGKKSVRAGVIQFIADNTGDEVHELAILKDGEEIAEIEGLRAGYVQSLRIRLEPGKYQLACLIVDVKPNGSIENHYALGMKTEFEVK